MIFKALKTKFRLNRASTRAFSLMEILVAMTILLIILGGVAKGFHSYMKALQNNKLSSASKELGESLKSWLLVVPYEELKTCFNPATRCDLIPGANGTMSLSCDEASFYVDTSPDLGTCNAYLGALYCMEGGKLVRATGATCARGTPLRVGYNSALVYGNLTDQREAGLVISIKIYYNDTDSKRKEQRYLVFRPFS